MAVAPNWAEQLTAIATSIGAVGLTGAIIAAVYAGQQVREARRGRQAQMAAEFIRRWNEDALVEARRLIDRFQTPQELSAAFQQYVASGAPEAYVLYRELDCFEQGGAREQRGAFDFELIRLLLGRTLSTRWAMWKPAIEAAHGAGTYPMFEVLARKMRAAVDESSSRGGAWPRPQARHRRRRRGRAARRPARLGDRGPAARGAAAGSRPRAARRHRGLP